MKTLKLFFLAIVAVITIGCAEMGAAMSNATANTCSYKACVVSVYDKETGNYLEDYMYTTYKGDDVTYSETSWVSRRQNNYMNYSSYGVWYETSPYTKSEYRFSTYCAQYHNNYGW